MQNNANAAALAGMNTVVAAKNGVKVSNQQVWESVQRSAASNRINNAGSDYIYYADYIVNNGGKTYDRVRLADWTGYGAANVSAGMAPDNIVRMQITMKHQVPAYFTPVVGWKNFQVNVEASACLSGYGLGVLSMGVPQYLVGLNKGLPYHVIYNSTKKLITPLDSRWGNWNQMQGMYIKFPIQNGTSGLSGTLIPWLSWGGSNGTGDLKAGMTFPGTLRDGFTEATPTDSKLPNTAPLKQLTLGDWVSGDTGLRAALNPELQKLRDERTEFALPIYDIAGSGGQSAFHIVRMGKFKLDSFDMTGSGAFIQLQYLGDKNYSVTECATPPPPPQPVYTLTGQARFTEVYSKPKTTLVPTSYDIVIVMDLSGSMNYDWNDQPTSGGAAARMTDARKAIASIVRGYNVEDDPDARMALVTFNKKSATLVEKLATSGCPKPSSGDDDDDRRRQRKADRKCTDDREMDQRFRKRRQHLSPQERHPVRWPSRLCAIC